MNRQSLVALRLLWSQIIAVGKLLPVIAAAALAEVSAPAAAPDGTTENSPPPISYHILRQRIIEDDQQNVVMNRVAPPTLPPEPVAPASIATENATAEAPAKKSVLLFLSATVYDHKITALGIMGASGKAGIFSNIDFNLLEGVGHIETSDAVYSLMLAVTNQSADEAAAHNQQLADEGRPTAWNRIPNLAEFSATHSECLVVEDATHSAPTDDELAGLNALHAFFDANKQSIAEKKAQREAAQAEAQRQLEEHPPSPQDIVVHYWKKSPAPVQSGQ